MTNTVHHTSVDRAGSSARSSRLRMLLRTISRDRKLSFLLICLALLAGIAILAPVLSPYDPIVAVAATPNMPVGSPGLILGSDNQARDILSRVLWGARISLIVSILPTLAATAVSIVIGLLAGFFGGRIDTVLMAVLDVFFAFPIVLLAIAVAGVMGPGLLTIIVSIFVVLLPYVTRVARTSALQVVSRPYIEAARSAGGGQIAIMLRYVLPNMIGPLIIIASFDGAQAIMWEAALSFLGLGFPPDIPTWGRLLFDAKDQLDTAPHWALFPGAAIFLTVLSINFIGDGLRDALDPRRVI